MNSIIILKLFLGAKLDKHMQKNSSFGFNPTNTLRDYIDSDNAKNILQSDREHTVVLDSTANHLNQECLKLLESDGDLKKRVIDDGLLENDIFNTNILEDEFLSFLNDNQSNDTLNFDANADNNISEDAIDSSSADEIISETSSNFTDDNASLHGKKDEELNICAEKPLEDVNINEMNNKSINSSKDLSSCKVNTQKNTRKRKLDDKQSNPPNIKKSKNNDSTLEIDYRLNLHIERIKSHLNDINNEYTNWFDKYVKSFTENSENYDNEFINVVFYLESKFYFRIYYLNVLFKINHSKSLKKSNKMQYLKISTMKKCKKALVTDPFYKLNLSDGADLDKVINDFNASVEVSLKKIEIVLKKAKQNI